MNAEMAEKNYYKTLGVAESATAEEIKKAFRRLAKELHPDRNPGDKEKERRFKDASEAYDTLSDDKKRAEYDTLRRFGGMSGAGGAPFGGQAWGKGSGARGFTFESVDGFSDLGEMFASVFGGSSAPGGATGRRTGRRGASPFGGASRPEGAPQREAGPDALADLHLSFDEAIRGGKKQITIAGQDGQKTINVTVPQGIEQGEKIRLRGLGGESIYGGPRGDLIVTLQVAAHPRFTREGVDLKTRLTAPFKVFALGGKVPVDTLTGKALVTIPAGSQSGAVFRLRGQGVTAKGKTGDLLVEAHVETPRTLTEEQRRALDAF